jgi:outer membrane protein OmpA-like peptidoglycan-associated protein/Tol biopolymer transport system component
MQKIIKIVVLLVFGSNVLSAQIDKGNTAFEDLKYQEAIQFYEKGLQKKSNPEAAFRLAESYRLTGQELQAEKWYKVAIDGGQNQPEVRVQYAKMLLSNNKTAEARAEAELVVTLAPNNILAQNIIKACDTREVLLQSGKRYTVTPLPFNDEGLDFCPIYFRDDLVFTSDRDETGTERSDWTGRNYTSIYQVPATGGTPEKLRGDINGRYNDGAAVFSADGQTMFFTRNNYVQNERRSSKKDIVKLIIASAQFESDQWKLAAPFPYNSDEFNTAHPALSTDSKMLIFASDRPGGQGGMDLWRCEWNDNSWSTPVNLGPEVNTPDNELFPYLAPDGALIFASNGWPGLGGLDIFIAQPVGNTYSEPENVGAPINSSKDDFGCITRDGMESGFFSSNVNSAIGTEDIYSFKRKPAQPVTPQKYLLNGLVVDKFTGIPLPGVAVTLENVRNGQTQSAETGENGRFEFALKPNSEYRIVGTKNGVSTNFKTESTINRAGNGVIFTQLEHNDPRFTLKGKALNRKTNAAVEGVEVTLLNINTMQEEKTFTDANGAFFFQLAQQSNYTVTGQKAGVFTSVKSASTEGLDRSTDLYVQLTLNVEIIEIGKEIELEDIYFDLNKADIRPDAAKILDNMVDFMLRNGGIVVELTSHTDARNTQEYNQALSQRRAESTMAYLLSKGVPAARMTAKGYGETQLVNRCADGVPCTEAEHQQNRRTAFRVLKY